MSVIANVAEDGCSVTINVNGRFDFTVHEAFREAYEQVSPSEGSFEINLANTEYMDSSALGMLLMLREHVGGDRERVKITNCRDEIQNVLAIANFPKLFEIGAAG